MSAKRRGRQASDQQHDSTSREPADEEQAEKKVLAIWQAFDQIFGIRWSQAFGNDPLGKYKNADGIQNPRMDQWIEALKPMPWPRVVYVLRKIRESPKPYDGWLPDLPSFLSFAGRLPSPERPREPPQKTSWISSICGMYLLRAAYDHGPFSEESMERLVKVQLGVAAKYNAMAREEKEIDSFTPEERAEWREVIHKDLENQFKKTPVDPMPQEERERRMTLPVSSPTRASSSS